MLNLIEAVDQGKKIKLNEGLGGALTGGAIGSMVSGSRTNEKRIEEGTHNWLGSEHNKKLVDAGTHNLLGSSQNEKMLAEGKHPSQQKVTCKCCDWTVSVGMFKRWHSEGKCHMNPTSSRYNLNLKQR